MMKKKNSKELKKNDIKFNCNLIILILFVF